MYHHPSSAHRAFTLIELLVVITIISILAAILFPVFAKVREKARQTSCLANEKHLALGIIAYTQDFDERFPTGNGTNGAGWAGVMSTYTQSAAIYKCPNDVTVLTVATPANTYLSYAYNSNLVDVSIPTKPTGISQATMTAAARTILIFEISGVANVNAVDPTETTSVSGNGGANLTLGKYETGVFSGDGYDPLKYSNKVARHGEGTNYAFADAHARWLRPTAVSAGATNTVGGNDPGVYPNASPDAPPLPGVAPMAASSTASISSLAATFSAN